MQRSFSSALTARIVAVAAFVAGAAVLVSSSDTPAFTVHDKAFYADQNLVNFVRPGLVLKLLTASVSTDRVPRVRFSITDPKGLPLDLDGITTPGSFRVLAVIGYIPPGQDQYVAYTTRSATSPITSVTAVQPYYDSGGKFEKVAEGTYDYVFGARLPEGYDRGATHSIGVRATRDLSEFELSAAIANEVIHFVPSGGAVTKVRDLVRTETCNRCHDPLQMHGGGNRRVDMCIICHNPQAVDPDTGNSVDFPVLIHKIHSGANLPSVRAGRPFRIIGSRPDQIFDFSDVHFPADVRNCEVCHNPNSGAKQADGWLKPNRAACGACHDDVNFATGAGHVNLPQISDRQCSNCHPPQGEVEFDASIRGAHTIDRFSPSLPGVVADILKVDDGIAGKRPTVTFSIKNKQGNPLLPSQMDYLYLILTGPTSEYAESAVSEDVRKAEGANGVYFWTFQNSIPADAKGSYGMAIAAYRNIKLLEGTKKEITARDIAANKVVYFSVDGTPVQPRRQVVSIDKCNECHFSLGMHGNGRNRTDHCVQCHNPSLQDATGSAAAGVPPGTLLFRYMIHRIHTGHESKDPYIVYGRTRQYNFSDVRFPGDRRNCGKCHVDGSEQLPLPEGLPAISNPRGPLNPMGPTAAACLGCHTGNEAAAHARAMTNDVGESCAVCHGRSAEFSVNRVHAK